MKLKVWSIITLLVMVTTLVAACGGSAEATDTPKPEPTKEEIKPEPTEAPVASEKAKVNMWSHSAGNPDEIAVVEQMIADFNAGQDQYEVVLEAFPQASYNDSVAAASVAGSLPCLVDLDGPTVPNFAWSGYVQPLPITESELAALGVLANDVGRYKDDIYSLGQFDVALLLYGRKSILTKYDIRIPTLDEPWTLDEFNAILETLQGSGEFENALDVNAGWSGEWWPYAYSPMLQSFGGDLIDRDTYLSAEGVLNGPEAVAWAEWFQSLFTNGYANPTPADDQGFFQGRVALWYTGSWSANAAVEAWGDDLLFLPAMDLGHGPKIGAGSWQWGISATCEQPGGAWAFIKYIMEPEQIALMSETTGLIPTTEAAANLTDNYGEGGPYRVFYEMADRYALVRSPTPGYLIISSEFERAGLKIRDGENVQDALDDAVDAIERDIEDHRVAL
jgi:multiple sugar transport system substrate-binding protein